MERRVETERIVVPASPIRQFSAQAASDLEHTIARIEKWVGKPFPNESRPYAALEVLREVSTTARFTREQRGDDSGLRAIQLALDLAAIADSLPSDLVKDLRKDLETCAFGPLDPPPDALQPLQAQSQLIVRGALFRAGVSPGQPSHSGSGGRKKPDILVENGLSTYGIEVKRPTALRNVLPRARDAAEQLKNAGVNGGIVLDLTDCITPGNETAVDDEILRQADAVTNEFFADGKGWKPGASHIWMITVMARPAWQVVMANEKDGQVLIHSTSVGVALGTAQGTLDTIRAKWLRRKVAEGLNRLGFTYTEVG